MATTAAYASQHCGPTTTNLTTTTTTTVTEETNQPAPQTLQQSQTPHTATTTTTTNNQCIYSLRQEIKPASSPSRFSSRPRVNPHTTTNTSTTNTTTATTSPTTYNTSTCNDNIATAATATGTDSIPSTAAAYLTVHSDKRTPITTVTSPQSTATTTPRRRLPLAPQSQTQADQHHQNKQQQQNAKLNNKSTTENKQPPKPLPRSKSAQRVNKPTQYEHHDTTDGSPLNPTSYYPNTSTNSGQPSEKQGTAPTPRPRSKKNPGITTNVPIKTVRLKLDNCGDLVTSDGKVSCAEDIIPNPSNYSQVSDTSSLRTHDSGIDTSSGSAFSRYNNSSGDSGSCDHNNTITNSERHLRKSGSHTNIYSDIAGSYSQDKPNKSYNSIKSYNSNKTKQKSLLVDKNTNKTSSINKNNDISGKVSTKFTRSSTCSVLDSNHQNAHNYKLSPQPRINKGSTSNSPNNLARPSVTDRPFARKGSYNQIDNNNNNNYNNNNKTREDNSQSDFGLYDADFRKATSSASAVFSQLLGGASRSHSRVYYPLVDKDRDSRGSEVSSDSLLAENSSKQQQLLQQASLTRNGYRLGSDATSDNSSSKNGVKKIRFYITDDDDDYDDDENDDNVDDDIFSEGDGRNENGYNLIRGDKNHINTNNRFQGNVKKQFGIFSSDLSKHSSSSFESSSRHDEERTRSQQSGEEKITLTDSALRRMSATELPPIADNLAASTMAKGRNDKRKTSTNSVTSNGSKNSSNQLPASVNGKHRKLPHNTNNSTPDNSHKNNSSNHHSDSNNNVNTSKTMKKKKTLIPRNHSDSSLKGLIARNNSSLSQASNHDKDGVGGGTGNDMCGTVTPVGTGSNAGVPPPPAGSNRTNPKFLNKGSRALSWCATENSGSQTKLETLFEGQNANSTISNNIGGSNGNLVNSNSSLNMHMPLCNSSGNLLLNGGGVCEGGGVGGGFGGGSGNEDFSMPAIHPMPDRCVSVNGVRSREEVMRLQASNRKLMSEAGDVEISTLDDFIDRGRMRRSQSDNKLLGNSFYNSSNSLNSGGGGAGGGGGGVGGGGGGNSFNNSYNSNSNKNNVHNGSSNNISMVKNTQSISSNNNNVSTITNNNNNNNSSSNNNNSHVKNGTSGEQRASRTSTSRAKQNHRTMSRNLSVDRIDRLTVKPARKTSTSSRTGGLPLTNSRMRRVSSVSALHTPKASRAGMGGAAGENGMEDGLEDELCVEASARLVEWLNEVNNVDEYETDPKDTVIDYLDEPPQTDTALHVVYKG